MNKRDQKFFDEHWEEWIERNPPPEIFRDWEGRRKAWAEKAWAEVEMPCRGFLGRSIFAFGLWLQKKK